MNDVFTLSHYDEADLLERSNRAEMVDAGQFRACALADVDDTALGIRQLRAVSDGKVFGNGVANIFQRFCFGGAL